MIPNIGINQLERILRDAVARITALEVFTGRMQSGNVVLTTDGSSVGTVTFAQPYAAAPIVVASPYDVVYHVRQINPTTTGFTFIAHNQAGAGLASTQIRIGWIAIPANN